MIILLADDERMVRLGLKSMLDELYPNTYTYIEAKNGKELVSLVFEYKPHIAFVDINMPLLNGLAAIEQCKDQTLLTHWIMLTGYADFGYARAAIKLGVSDYLLKPISIQELSLVMTKTEKEINGALDKLNHSFALEIISAYNLSQVCTSSDSILVPSSSCNTFETYMFYIDNLDRTIRYHLLTELSEKLRQLFSNTMDNDGRYALFYLNSGELCLVMNACKKAISLYAFLTDFINHANDPITVFYSMQLSVQQFCCDCQNISEISNVRLIHKLGTIINYNELMQNTNLDIIVLIANALEKLCLAFIQGDEIEYKHIIKDMYRNQSFHKFFSSTHAKNIEKYLKAVINLKLSFTDYTSLLDGLLKHSNAIYLNLPQRSNIDIMSQIERYIKENYMNEIGINCIAEIYDITPNYLSKIFHQKVGKKFIDYLTEVRIINAKRILSENPNCSIKDLSIKVGYYSTRHFTKMFFKVIGVLPSEYQKQVLGK